mgnify:CR=1 FL=1
MSNGAKLIFYESKIMQNIIKNFFRLNNEKLEEIAELKIQENNKQIKLISTNGSACVTCKLCVYGKADIRFSASKK